MNPERARNQEQPRPEPLEPASKPESSGTSGPGLQPDARHDPLKEVYSAEQAEIVDALSELRDPSKDAVMEAYMTELKRLSIALLEASANDPHSVEGIAEGIQELQQNIEEHRSEQAARIAELEVQLKDMNDFLNPFKGMGDDEVEQHLGEITFSGITDTEVKTALEPLVEQVTDDMIIGYADEPDELIPGARAASTVEASAERDVEQNLPFTPFENNWFEEGEAKKEKQEEEIPLTKEELIALMEKNVLRAERESSLTHEEEQLTHEVKTLLDGNGKVAGVRQIEEYAERKYGMDFDALILSPRLKVKAAMLRLFSPQYRNVEQMYRERISMLTLKQGLLHDVKFRKKDPRGYLRWQAERARKMEEIKKRRKAAK